MGYYEYKITKELIENRILAFERADYKCEICGEKAEEIHHKDNSKIDHSLSNLQALCCKCHRRITYLNNKDRNLIDVENIDYLLEKKNMSRNDLADKIKIDQSSLEGAFARKRTWRKRIIKIAEVLECDIDEILVKKEAMS